MDILQDQRIVLTLDAGGTNLVFSAMRGGREIIEPILRPSQGHDLEACLGNILGGFQAVRDSLDRAPAAISFAFPGPADYPNGIIGDLYNLPGFRGGVPLGPMLEDRFGIPACINNDGDLFTYGEAMEGLLPQVNRALAQTGNPKRYRNLLGITLGTGLGAGLVHDGRLYLGDNGAGAEIWCMRNKLDPSCSAEEGVSIRAVRRTYARLAGLPMESAPEPKTIHRIALGERQGHREAALEAFRRLGEVAGDTLANACALADGLVVVGGGLAGAADFILPALVAEMRGTLRSLAGGVFPRMEVTAFNLEDPGERAQFLAGSPRRVPVPGSGRLVGYEPTKRVGVGVTQLGTSRATSVGAYAFALEFLDRGPGIKGSSPRAHGEPRSAGPRR
jgi:glucokinase